MNTQRYAGDVSPRQAWDILNGESNAVLVDVRTPAEWAYVGIPDLGSIGKEAVFIPWVHFPTMQVNTRFAEQVEQAGIPRDAAILFLCRSGARSRAAAIEMTGHGFGRCYNIGTGFEGDPDGARHRGSVNGWKVEGLPWVQS
jgi:rhodanese-related sulfurtransferase